MIVSITSREKGSLKQSLHSYYTKNIYVLFSCFFHRPLVVFSNADDFEFICPRYERSISEISAATPKTWRSIGLRSGRSFDFTHSVSLFQFLIVWQFLIFIKQHPQYYLTQKHGTLKEDVTILQVYFAATSFLFLRNHVLSVELGQGQDQVSS